ncbi:MAG: cell division protein FtsZ, partial [Candidatus Thiodiazotropha taylori]
ADEDAPVVVGTVIDPDMQNDMRVTVVATGLGERLKAELPKPTKVEDLPPVKLVDSQEPQQVPEDYRELDRPTVLRNSNSDRSAAVTTADGNLDYLDIPAFLRRQAD